MIQDIGNSQGNLFQVNTTHPNHYAGNMQHKAGQLRQSEKKDDFFSMLQSSLEEMNQKQHKASDLTRKMITNPEQVEVHDVMVAVEHAKMSLNLARVVRDTTIKSYNKITNLR